MGAENISCFSADREFIGEEWFKYLKEQNIPFVIRIKENSLLKKINLIIKLLRKRFVKELRKEEEDFFKDVFNIWGIDVYLAAARNDKGELMILVSNNKSKSTFKHYLKRWSIEVLFKYLKKHGFNLESTHITTNKSLEVLFFILTLAVVWTVKVSSSLEKESPP